MPQIMIDTATDTIDSLRRFATLLQDEADSREEATTRILENVPAGTSDKLPPALIAQVKALQAAEQQPIVDTAAIFRKQPAGLDGHGENPAAPLAVMPPVLQTAPLAPPMVTAAALPAMTPAAATTAVVLDSAGIPHDPRIHQDTRKMNKNNTWQNKRGLDKDLLAAVTAELKAAWGKPAEPPAAMVAAGNAILVAQGLPPVPAAPLPPTAPVAPPPPPAIPAAVVADGVAPLPPVNPPVPGAITGFRELMQKITSNTNAGKLSNEQVDAALASVGLPPRQLIALVNQPALIPGMSAYIDACLAAS